MIVYRYEDADGYGPYWRYRLPDMSEAHNATARDPDSCQPTPGPDLGLSEGYGGARLPWNGRFACPSIEALNVWFKDWHIDLEKRGFRVVLYEVSEEDVLVGKSGLQCVFPLLAARRVEC